MVSNVSSAEKQRDPATMESGAKEKPMQPIDKETGQIDVPVDEEDETVAGDDEKREESHAGKGNTTKKDEGDNGGASGKDEGALGKETAVGGGLLSSSGDENTDEDNANIVTIDETDPEHPYNWPAWRVWLNCGLFSAMCFVAPLASCKSSRPPPPPPSKAHC
jgi:hypothetical protein